MLDAPGGAASLPETGDASFLSDAELRALREAAVLITLRETENGQPPDVLFTTRPASMAKHPGQVAFPGGKIDPGDRGPVDAALREAEEEVGLPRRDAEVIARSAPYITGTGFRITPVMAVIPPGFAARPDPVEVDDAFSVPLPFLMDPANFLARQTEWKGETRHYTEILYGQRRIWGVTAGMIREIQRRLYAPA